MGSGKSKLHPTWPWIFPGTEHLPLLWVTCSSVSPLVKNFFLISSPNLPSLSLKPLPLVLYHWRINATIKRAKTWKLLRKKKRGWIHWQAGKTHSVINYILKTALFFLNNVLGTWREKGTVIVSIPTLSSVLCPISRDFVGMKEKAVSLLEESGHAAT